MHYRIQVYREVAKEYTTYSIHITPEHMKLFKTALMSTWDIGVLKLAVLCIGLAIGAKWATVFAPYTTALFIIGVLIGLYSLYTWAKK